MSMNLFTELEKTIIERGMDAALERLAAHLLAEEKFHELFDVRLMQARSRLGLPVVTSASIDELPTEKRKVIEAAYLAACEEVGQTLLDRGRFREAWMYYQPLGKPEKFVAAIREAAPTEENIEELIELSLGHMLAPSYGFQLVLQHYGMCNAITNFDREMQRCSPKDLQEAAQSLVAELHRELLISVQTDIERRNGEKPTETSLAGLLKNRNWLLEGNNYHTDVSHIHSVIRIARIITNRASLELTYDICEYAKRLSPDLQSAGDAPFENMYEASSLFFGAQIGKHVDEAITYFTQKAEATDVYSMGSAPAETLIVLLARIGRYDEAIAASMRWIPPGTHNGGFAPSLFELSKAGGQFAMLKSLNLEKGDLLNYVMALACEHDAKLAEKSA